MSLVSSVSYQEKGRQDEDILNWGSSWNEKSGEYLKGAFWIFLEGNYPTTITVRTDYIKFTIWPWCVISPSPQLPLSKAGAAVTDQFPSMICSTSVALSQSLVTRGRIQLNSVGLGGPAWGILYMSLSTLNKLRIHSKEGNLQNDAKRTVST